MPETKAVPINDLNLMENAFFPNSILADQQILFNHTFNPTNDADVSDLLNFLENDLDKYLSPSL